jgi:DNA polymerase I-like protein with 3'-5' exonuclease and polymerase domains
LSSRTISVSKEFKKEGVDVEMIGDSRLIKVSYSNKRTLTGRIVANSLYNPQNLDKKTQDRENIISRFDGGKIVVFDYTSFEARIALYFSGDDEFIKKFYKKDIHMQTANIIFGDVQISKENRDFAKSINNHILYGASKGTVINKISYLSNPEEVYYNIRQFLAPLLKKFDELFKMFKEKGYIINPWGTIVRPEKDFASFNNFLQSSAVEIIVDQLYKIKKFLSDYKSQFLFQVHDSLVFDIHPKEAVIIRNLAKLLMCHENMFFNISYSSGFDYKNLSVPIEVVERKCK